MSIPNNLNYGVNKSYAAKGAKADYLMYKSDSQIYRDGSEIRIEIPTGARNTHLIPHLSTLNGRIKLKGITGAVNSIVGLDNSIYSIFRNMNNFHGSQPLEPVEDCSRIWSVLYDVQKNEYERGPDSITMLCDGSKGIPLVTLAATAQAESDFFDFSFVLPSAIFGHLATKSLALGQLGASSLYINLGLHSAAIALTGNVTSVASFEISDIYFCAKVVTLPDEVESSIMRSINNVIMMPAYAYRTEMRTFIAGGTSFTDKFSFFVSSMKNFIFWFTNSDTANGTTAGITKRSITSRQNCNIKSYQLMINGSPYPSNVIDTTSGMYNHLMRAFESLTDTNSGGILDRANFATAAKTGDTAFDTYNYIVANPVSGDSRFVAAIDTDVFNASGDVLLSGISTYGTSLALNVTLSNSLVQNQNLYAAIMYDVLFILTDGILMPKS